MEEVDRELRKKGVTLALLWEEYKAREPEGYQYTRFCQLYRQWKEKQEPVMRQTHTLGERAYLDFAGETIPYIEPGTGEIKEAKVLWPPWGPAPISHATSFKPRTSGAWVLGKCLAFEDFGGVPRIITPDNPKAVVVRADRYEPQTNPTHLEMAEYYGVVVEPALPRKPRDKAPVKTLFALLSNG